MVTMITSPLLFKVFDGDKVGVLAMTRACSCDQALLTSKREAHNKSRMVDKGYIAYKKRAATLALILRAIKPDGKP